MSTKYVEDTGSLLLVRMPKTKQSVARTFIIENKTTDGVNMFDICRKYFSLRNAFTPHDRLFVFYRNGRCTNQTVGLNCFGRIPAEIAKYLGLDPKGYTGHSFKKSAKNIKLRKTVVENLP